MVCNAQPFVKIHIYHNDLLVKPFDSKDLYSTKRFYYRRPGDNYYTMKTKQEPVSRFDIS